MTSRVKLSEKHGFVLLDIHSKPDQRIYSSYLNTLIIYLNENCLDLIIARDLGNPAPSSETDV